MAQNPQSCYKLNPFRRGNVYIFNHLDDGIDRDRLKEIFNKLHFNVFTYNKCRYQQINEILEKASTLRMDCLIVITITHGDKHGIECSDYDYHPELLWSRFTHDNCPQLIGKPKIFIIDACRGKIIDKGVRVQFDGDGIMGDIPLKLPLIEDFLIVYSTQKDHFGYGDSTYGSWFIRAFCEELKNRHKTWDLLSILTFTNKRLTILHEGNNQQNQDFHGTKQSSSVVHSLTNFIYF